ncbi:MAG: CotH kinase family protein [Bacteroidia bacterium]|nr:CotH kinase family protein [Bacteroidia bacterium]
MKKTVQILLIALFISIRSAAQISFYDLNTIQLIEITFTQPNWDYMLDTVKAGSDGYLKASKVKINGVEFNNVGVKYKGNSSYNAARVKNPFHIELDTYQDQDYMRYTDIKLSNAFKDPSFLREVLSYKIIRNYMPAPKSNFANVYVNNQLPGLYSNTESVGKKFVKDRFGSKSNTFIKCNPINGAGPDKNPNLVYLGADSSLYYGRYEMESDYGWYDLINLCDTLKNHISAVENTINVNEVLWMLAFNNLLVNLDSYLGKFSQNYYLYKDSHHRFRPVVWDLNEAFGTFSETGTSNLTTVLSRIQMTHLLHTNDNNWPLVKNLLAIPTYKRMYLAHMRTILNVHFINDSYRQMPSLFNI